MRLRPVRVLLHCALLSGLAAACVLGPLITLRPILDVQAAQVRAAESVVVDPEVEDSDASLEQELRLLAVKERKLAVETELATLEGHAWAGEYYHGDGLGANITHSMSPGAGVSVQWRGCLGIYGANEGLVATQPDGSLAMHFNHANGDGFGSFDEHLVPVRWGERHYLIPQARMIDFVNAIHFGREPRSGGHGSFPLMRGDEGLEVEGLPDLPSPYREMIRSVAIEARVLSVERLPDEGGADYCMTNFRVTIDRGAGDGLLPGVALQPLEPFDAGDLLLDYVESTRAEGIIRNFETDCAKPDTLPSRDWIFTTGSYEPTR